MKRLISLFIGASLILAPGAALADPFTIDDLLRTEELGQVSLSPSGRSVAFERLGPMDGLPAYEYDYMNRLLRTRLHIAPSQGEAEPRLLLEPETNAGYGLGPWAPDDGRVLVYRLQDRTYSAGVVDPRDGSVRWLDGTPETAMWGRAALWRDPSRALVLMRADGDMPPLLSLGWVAQDRLPAYWAKTRAGVEAARTLIGAGRFADLTPRAAVGRLVQLDASTGEQRTLAHGRFYDMELSPDGRHLALGAFAEEQGFDPAAPFFGGDFTERRHLTILDLETGETWSPAPNESLSPHLFSWSPGGDELLVYVRSPRAGPAEGELVRLRPRDRRRLAVDLQGHRPAVAESGLRTPVVSADWFQGEPVLYTRNPSGRADWTLLAPDGARVLTTQVTAPAARLAAVTHDRIVVSDAGQAVAIDAEGGTRILGRTVTPAFTPNTSYFNRGQRFDFTGASRARWLMVETDGERRRRDIRTGDPIGPVAPPTVRLAAFDATTVVTTDRRQGLVQSLDRPGGTTLVTLNTALESRTFVAPREITHRSGDRTLTSWLYLPTGIDRPPLIVLPYPGQPERPQRPEERNIMLNAHLMTARGYAVLIPNLPDYGLPGNPAEGMADGILKVVEAAGAQGGFDPERLILWGHSFGGFSVMAAATQSDRFVAVIGANGPYDLFGRWGAFPLARSVAPEKGLSVRSHAGSVEMGQGGMRAPPWADPQAYVRNSPLMAADRITAPVLLVTGDLDYITDSQSEAMFTALYRQNKDVALLTYRGEGHVLASPGNIRDYWSTALSWLDGIMARLAASDTAQKGQTGD